MVLRYVGPDYTFEQQRVEINNLASDVVGMAATPTYSITSEYATTAGVSTALQNLRTFEITGDIIASPISFDGTSNVSLAATINPTTSTLGIATAGGTVGTGVTLLDFRGAGISTVTVSSGIATINIEGGGSSTPEISSVMMSMIF